MNETTPNRATHPASRCTALALVLLLTSGCVSERKYQEVVELSRMYQDSYHDLQSYVAQLEAEQASMEARVLEAQAIDPEQLEKQLAEMVPDPQIEAQLAELSRIAAALGGAPGDVVPIPVEGGYGFSLKESVLFPSGSADLREDGQRILLQLAADIATRPFQTLWVRGHTDSVPVSKPETLQRFPRGNLELSSARALEVAALLISQGRLPAGKIAVAGLGSNRPVDTNETAEGRRRNRRVEIFVLEEDPELEGRESGAPDQGAEPTGIGSPSGR
jgi:chemotaxis protein MotB